MSHSDEREGVGTAQYMQLFLIDDHMCSCTSVDTSVYLFVLSLKEHVGRRRFQRVCFLRPEQDCVGARDGNIAWEHTRSHVLHGHGAAVGLDTCFDIAEVCSERRGRTKCVYVFTGAWLVNKTLPPPAFNQREGPGLVPCVPFNMGCGASPVPSRVGSTLAPATSADVHVPLSVSCTLRPSCSHAASGCSANAHAVHGKAGQLANYRRAGR